MQRYNKITEKNPREIVLLKSLPCVYGKCTFCNYIEDNTTDIDEIHRINHDIIQMINGEFGVLEVINSGSIFELPKETLGLIRDQMNQKNIHTLYAEAYYAYHKQLGKLRDFFPNQAIRYCIGIETFDDEFRKNVLKKPFPTHNLDDLSEKFYVCYLLICIEGQTKAQITHDIEIACTHFREVVINVFVNNTTSIKRDEALVNWFINDIYPDIKDEQRIEILIDNKDFGVYVQ